MDPESENLALLLHLNQSKVITKNIKARCDYNQNFCFVKETRGDLFLIWATQDNNLEVYDLNEEIVIDTIKAHDDGINSCHHFYDPIKNKDYVITSSDDKTIKIWQFIEALDIGSVECRLKNILTVKQDTIGNFRNACMFTDFEEKKNYILVELSDYIIAIYSEKGQYLRKIEGCIFFDVWTDEKFSRSYIVTSYAGKVKFYDFKTGKVSKEFNSEGKFANAAIVNNLLILADDNGSITTYDIYTGEIVNENKDCKTPITELTIWDVEYFFAGTSDGKFECYETKTLTKVNSIENLLCEKVVYGLSFIHPRYGAAIAISGPFDLDKAVLTILTTTHHLPGGGL